MPPAALDPVQRAEQCHGELGLVGDAESVDVNDGRTLAADAPGGLLDERRLAVAARGQDEDVDTVAHPVGDCAQLGVATGELTARDGCAIAVRVRHSATSTLRKSALRKPA